MQSLVEKIKSEALFIPSAGILKVDGFLNHQLDISLLESIGKEFFKRFSNESPDKILTIEASGIAIAVLTSQHFNNIPVIFAKKFPNVETNEKTQENPEFFEASAYSFTKKTVNKIRVARKFLKKGEKVLILDDFLAEGSAALCLVDILKQAEAKLVGIGIVIEKGFQEGGEKLRKLGLPLHSLVIIDKDEKDRLVLK